MASTVRITMRVNPMLYGKTGGEGVGGVGRYLWYTLSLEKAKMTIPRRRKWKKEDEEDLKGR